MNRLYRIFLELTEQDKTVSAVSAIFSGFTLSNALGYWEGKPEQSAIIEIVAHHTDKSRVQALCATLRDVNRQQSVLLEVVKNTAELI